VKAIELAQRDGAACVIGVDIGSEFLTPPADLDVTLVTGDLSELGDVPELRDCAAGVGSRSARTTKRRTG
jgi:hypothetical protein